MSRLFNARTLAILFQGFSSGLPIALCTGTLQAWFAADNINILTIGFLTLIGQPYVYKFLWAPFLDRFIPPFLGRRRGWIVIMQLGLFIAISAMAFGHPKEHVLIISMLALVVALLSATQDIAIDAYRTDILKPEERGLGAAFTITGFRVAMIVSGGMGLILADRFGFRAMYLIMAMLMLVNILATLFSPESPHEDSPQNLFSAFVEPWREFRMNNNALLILLFIVLYKVGDAFTVSLSSAFLIESLHFSLSIVGTINKIVGIAASIVGALVGGILLSRLNIYRSLWWFGLLLAMCSFLYMALAIYGRSIPLLVTTIFADNFFSGLSGVALIAFITNLCDKRYSAAQYALLSAISAIGRVFVGPFAGVTVHYVGWAHFFFISFFVSIPGLWLLWHLRNSYDGKLFIVPVSEKI